MKFFKGYSCMSCIQHSLMLGVFLLVLFSKGYPKVGAFTIERINISTRGTRYGYVQSTRNKTHQNHLHKIENPVGVKRQFSRISSQLYASSSLIQANDSWGNIAALCTIASVSQTVGEKTTPGKLLGAPVTAMAIAFVAGSIGILPAGGSEGCKILQMISLQLATPLLLIGADVRAAARRCGPLLVAFILAAFATLVAGVLAISMSSKMLVGALGPHDSFKIAAALLAKNIGGGINYIAVCQALGASPSAVAAGLCVDNIYALIYFPVTGYLASGKPDLNDWKEHDDSTYNEEQNISSELSVDNVSKALAIAAIMTSLGIKIGGSSSALPVATLLTVLFATFSPQNFSQKLRPTGEVLGTSLLYLFFATAGAPGMAIADAVQASFVPLSIFLLVLYGFHGAIIEVCRRLFKNYLPEVMKPQRLLCASSASIGGPATAAALASSNKWFSLVAPSLLVGNLGYAVATFIGIAFHAASRAAFL